MSLHSPRNHTLEMLRYYLSQQETMPYPTTKIPSTSSSSAVTEEQPVPLPEPAPRKKLNTTLIIVLVAAVVLACTLYFIWRPASPQPAAPTIVPQTSTVQVIQPGKKSTATGVATTSVSTTNNTSAAGGTIQAYIVGAVKHPGVYTLSANARVYQLLQAAGGPLPNADLNSLNLAAKVSDGQEIYVTLVGEEPPVLNNTTTGSTSTGSSTTGLTSGATGTGSSVTGSSSSNNNATGQIININTASASEMQQNLHVSSKTAQNIVAYRTQHGSFSSVQELLQVISKTIYNRIKNQVTV